MSIPGWSRKDCAWRPVRQGIYPHHYEAHQRHREPRGHALLTGQPHDHRGHSPAHYRHDQVGRGCLRAVAADICQRHREDRREHHALEQVRQAQGRDPGGPAGEDRHEHADCGAAGAHEHHGSRADPAHCRAAGQAASHEKTHPAEREHQGGGLRGETRAVLGDVVDEEGVDPGLCSHVEEQCRHTVPERADAPDGTPGTRHAGDGVLTAALLTGRGGRILADLRKTEAREHGAQEQDHGTYHCIRKRDVAPVPEDQESPDKGAGNPPESVQGLGQVEPAG